MKESSGLVKGACLVGKVETFENLTELRIYDLYKQYYEQIFTTAWKESASGFRIRHTPPAKWLDSKHATLIHIAEVNEFHTPFAVNKRDRRAWVVYDRISDFTKTFVDENLRESLEDILSSRSEILAFLKN